MDDPIFPGGRGFLRPPILVLLFLAAATLPAGTTPAGSGASTRAHVAPAATTREPIAPLEVAPDAPSAPPAEAGRGDVDVPLRGPRQDAGPRWGGYIGTLDRHVRRTLEARERQLRSPIARPRAWPMGAAASARPSAGAAGTEPALPGAVQFGLAAPNPSRGAVAFALELPAAARIRFVIHDVAGRVIHVETGERSAGAHTLRWDGRDRTGAHVPAGIFFATLEVDGRPAGIRRTVVLR